MIFPRRNPARFVTTPPRPHPEPVVEPEQQRHKRRWTAVEKRAHAEQRRLEQLGIEPELAKAMIDVAPDLTNDERDKQIAPASDSPTKGTN